MRSGRSCCLAWFFALMLVLSPILSAGPADLASAQDDGAPVEEVAPADPVVEEATETPTPVVDVPINTPTATPTETATEITVETPTETATVVEEPASPTDVPATDIPATEIPATDVPATEIPATGTPTETPTGTPVPTENDAVGGAGAPAGTATPVVTTGQIAVTVSCRTDPETIRVTNNGAAAIQLNALATLFERTAGEPFPVNRTLKAGQTAIFQAGHAAQYGTVLTSSYIFTNAAYDQDGVKIQTSIGYLYQRCAAESVTPTPTPVVTTDQINVTLSCLSTAESIRITNNGAASILIKGLATMHAPTAEEPFAVSRTLQPGHTAIFQAGADARYGTVLTKSYIFTNSAYDADGIRISTSIGKLYKRCAPKPQPVGEKWIDINLSTQYAVAYQGGTVVNQTSVSTGKPGFETPTGTFYILIKYLTDDMAGCEGGECWSVPAVPWVNYFTNYGHALHGKYWNNIYGTTSSHGCVNLPPWFAEWFYYWAPYGMRVVIHY